MPEEIESENYDDSAAPLSERRGFAPDQLVACEECLRANPPTRLNCLYCGVDLPVTEASAALRRPALKRLEEWEPCFNVVLLPRASDEIPASAIDDAADWLGLERVQLREIASAGCALPIARANSREDAELISTRLGSRGLAVEIFADEVLTPADAPARRIRALDMTDAALVGRASSDGENISLHWTDVSLLVSGRLFTKRVEVEARQGRLRRDELVEARELVEDEAVLDIYPTTTGAGHEGWRIEAESFDYTCLGEAKGLLARDNFVSLARTLRERAPAARFDEDYKRVRHLLAHAWPLVEHTQSQGLKRERFGRFNTGAVTIVSNETQFTRYARMIWQLELRRRAHDR
ncbi:MAG: hypothetical protein WCD76_07190 [Pyrinomonadaceae bacterium]